MLLENFYTVDDFKHETGLITCTVFFNAGHQIFLGHFPGMPVVPGVCTMQIIKELLEQGIGVKTQIKKASQLKFLSLITPEKTPQAAVKIQYTKTETAFDITAEIRDSDRIYFKMKSTLTILG